MYTWALKKILKQQKKRRKRKAHVRPGIWKPTWSLAISKISAILVILFLIKSAPSCLCSFTVISKTTSTNPKQTLVVWQQVTAKDKQQVLLRFHYWSKAKKGLPAAIFLIDTQQQKVGGDLVASTSNQAGSTWFGFLKKKGFLYVFFFFPSNQ